MEILIVLGVLLESNECILLTGKDRGDDVAGVLKRVQETRAKYQVFLAGRKVEGG